MTPSCVTPLCEIKVKLYVYMCILNMSRCLMQTSGFFFCPAVSMRRGTVLWADFACKSQFHNSVHVCYSWSLPFRKLWTETRDGNELNMHVWKLKGPHFALHFTPWILWSWRIVGSAFIKGRTFFGNVQDQNYASD